MVMLFVGRGDYMFIFDLKSGYYYNDIHVCMAQHKYLGCALGREGKKQFYVFTSLPTGLATACYICMKVLKPLVKFWYGEG